MKGAKFDAASEARRLFSYDPTTGILTRRVDWYGRKAGTVAGSLCEGYLNVNIRRRHYKVHRIAWLLHYGQWPSAVIDHIDGKPSNNAIANLRDVPQLHNVNNRKGPNSNNSTGSLGVFVARKRFAAKVRVNRRSVHVGTFDTKQEAAAAYLEARRRLCEGNLL